MKKLKIIQIAHASHSYFANENDNLKKITLNDWYAKVSQQLKKEDQKLEIECWAPEKLNKEKEEFFWEGIKFRFFPVVFSPIYALDFSFQLLKELKKEIKKSKEEGYELIIHLHEYHNLHGLMISTLFGKRKIIAQHHGGSYPLKHIRENKKYRPFFLFFLLGQIWEKIALRNVNFFYSLSSEEIVYLKKVAPNSIIRFQTMGIEDEYFKQISKKIARKKLNLNPKEKIILFIGRLNEIKGVGILLESMKNLPEINLKIMGYGKERDKFEKYVKENNLKNVEFLGGVFGERKILYLSSADALVLPSSKEGAPVTIMEAIAKNLPVICTDVGGIQLMIENGREGIILKKRKSEEISKSIKEILKWGKKDISKYANKYNWKEIIKKTLKDYGVTN